MRSTLFLQLATIAGLAATSIAQPAGPTVQQLISDAICSGASVVELPDGEVRMGQETLRITGARNLTVDGTGTTLIFSNHERNGIDVQACENLVLKGFTVDYDPLPFTQATITATDVPAGRFEFEVHAGYPELTDDYLVRRAHLFEAEAPRWKALVPDLYPRTVERIDSRRGFFTIDPATPFLDCVAVGDRIVLNKRPATTVRIENSTAVRVEGVTLHAGPGLGFVGRFLRGECAIIDCRVVPGPTPPGATQPRLFSISADAVNFAYARRGPIIEGCEFSYMGDDSINLHGVTLPILALDDDKRRLVTARPYGYEGFERVIDPGDAARLLAATDYAVIGEPGIESWRTIEGEPALMEEARRIWPHIPGKVTFYELRLREPASAASVGDFFDIPAIAADGYHIANNHFHDHRARGIRLMSSDGEVRGNTLERIKQMAITLGPQYEFWREAGWVRNVVVADNVIRDVCQDQRSFAPDAEALGAISIAYRPTPAGVGKPMPRDNVNIAITGNTIDGSSTAGIYVRSAREVTVMGNRVSRTNTVDASRAGRQFGLSVTQPIDIAESDAVTVEDNTVAGR